MMKRLHLLTTLVFAWLATEGVIAEDQVYKTLDFANHNLNVPNIGSYTKTWQAKLAEDSWTLFAFNNNNRKWNYVRCGRKDVSSYPYIVNDSSYEEAVTKIEITVDNVQSDLLNSAKLLVSTDPKFGTVDQTIDFTFSFRQGIVTCNIPKPQVNSYYKIQLEIWNGKNGSIQISKVVYYKNTVEAPLITGTSTFLQSTTVTLTTTDEGAKLFYTTDGSDPTNKSTLYGEPFTLSTSATVKAIAYLNGKSSKIASQSFKKVEGNDLKTVSEAVATNEGMTVYVKGIVVETKKFDSNYPNLSYYIGDTEDAKETIQVFRGRYINNTDITNEYDIVRGDEVILAASVGIYNNKKELKDAYLLSIKEYQDKVNVSAAGWATFVSRRAVDFTKTPKVQAFSVKYDEAKDEIGLTQVEVIPGNTAVVVKADASTYNLERGEISTVAPDNDLKFYRNDTQVKNARSIYVLAKKNEGCGFYPLKTGETLAAFKGYLPITQTASAKPFFGLEATSTGIATTPAVLNIADKPRFNLSGQRVNNQYKGIVIIDGRKVIIK